MRALMMGRFQPFHLGHLDLVEKILDECDEVIIAVTSSQFNYLEKDPFTAGERIEMIHNSINDSQIDLSRCFIVGIENQFNVATWSAYLRSALPHFDKVYSGNDYVKMLLADSGIDVVTPKFLDRATYNATKIRKMMISGENWESFVPKAVVDYIKNINGENRLKVISQSDTKPTEH
ncbi:nicotinamide-nucleotide adenylyltransferase [Nitrosopumilus sp. K4]|uniref:nicotinamide-nucleotide adenylyltransferase n=1 Tax=Nitrosopumilus sp. K4 TaxID=2795383 RepID=UPI001BA9AE3D|nr:nicotinamide-nucleotide adenylyltransferase [Nitrosopumilus sp. K4]